ncbi:MAG: hypothetical protein GY768_23405 [Planctomycetaceae bacterium]|nr:hypothetical protein [Planctomycetaceae bacterium]
MGWSRAVSKQIRFPDLSSYLSSYLAFRELPLLLMLIDEVSNDHGLADVLVVDGSGIAHPRAAGIATMLGAVAQVSTIGISKKLLFGSVDTKSAEDCLMREIRDGKKKLGYAALTASRNRKPVFISPGFGLSVSEVKQLIKPFLERCPIPDPIYWADRISRQAAKNSTLTKP